MEYRKCIKGHSYIDLDCFLLQGIQVFHDMTIQLINFLRERVHYRNVIGDGAVTAIARALESNSTISTMYLSKVLRGNR